ncbi:MAG: MBL fold metallo-hydrolase [Bacteroidales bacterium]|nr:MBL fold metallo-hydrolase [Bacteroidales bacterium]
MTQFVSLSSGSNGNCYYIGNETCGILIDAGIGTRTIKKRMSEVGLSVDRVRCVLVSHDHFDHIRSLGTFAARFQKPVYATAPCIAAFRRHYCTRDFLDASCCHPLVPGEWLRLDGKCFDSVEPSLFDAKENRSCEKAADRRHYSHGNGIWVLPFSVPHDATDTVGFFIDFFGETFTFLTDVGDVTDDAVRFAARARHLIVEANYDPEMLRTGGYPADLQRRIRGGHGHLANAQTAELIRRALDLNGADSGCVLSGDSGLDSGVNSCDCFDSNTSGDASVSPLQDVFLCHLSENNNTPELALSTITDALRSHPRFAALRFTALPRREASDLFVWE